MYVCINTCRPTYTFAYMHIHTYTHVYIHRCIHNTYTHYTHIYIHTCMRAYIHTHAYLHTHTYTRSTCTNVIINMQFLHPNTVYFKKGQDKERTLYPLINTTCIRMSRRYTSGHTCAFVRRLIFVHQQLLHHSPLTADGWMKVPISIQGSFARAAVNNCGPDGESLYLAQLTTNSKDLCDAQM
jgi:hypothetical protein